METRITENEEFKICLDREITKQKHLTGREESYYGDGYFDGATTAQTILQKEHDNEMMDFDRWKHNNVYKTEMVNGELKYIFGSEHGGAIINFDAAIDLFRKEFGQ